MNLKRLLSAAKAVFASVQFLEFVLNLLFMKSAKESRGQ
jgi:hypothetical protein